jgi:hypothetical protein
MSLTDAWPAERFEERVAREPRLVVLFHADDDAGETAVRAFDDAAPACLATCVRAELADPADPRWALVEVAPTLAYFERGEELERAAVLAPRDVDAFLEHVEALNEDAHPVPRWLKRRRQPTSRRP